MSPYQGYHHGHIQGDFTNTGTFPGDPYKFKLKSNAKAASHAPRKVPIHLKDAFCEEVDNFVELGILEKVELPTEWVNSYVIGEREVKLYSGNTHSPNHTISTKLGLCLDPRDLNGLIGKLYKALYITIVDMKKGYWMVKLHPDSKPHSWMALEHERFQWTCLPMGTVVAGGVFQRELDEIYEGLPWVTGIANDIVIYGQSKEQHDRNFLCFLKVTRKAGI